MFTGLIEQVGEVKSQQVLGKGLRLSIRAQLTTLAAGESIAVDGVCLTVLPESTTSVLLFDISPETERLTTLGGLQAQDKVHLEQALLMSSRVGGHWVSGHVDTTVPLKAKRLLGEYIELTLGVLSEAHQAYVFPKGSIALSGVSLTVNTADAGDFTVMLIPHTLVSTKLGSLVVGQSVNVEFDYVARVVAHQLQQMGLKKRGCDVG